MTSIKFHGLDPYYYFSSPGLEIELEKILDKYLFIEKGLRRVISNIAKSYGKANNKYMKVYDSKEP